MEPEEDSPVYKVANLRITNLDTGLTAGIIDAAATIPMPKVTASRGGIQFPKVGLEHLLAKNEAQDLFRAQVQSVEETRREPTGYIVPVSVAQRLGINPGDETLLFGTPVTWVNSEDWGIIHHIQQAPALSAPPQRVKAALPVFRACTHLNITWNSGSFTPECGDCRQPVRMYSADDIAAIRAGA